MATNPKELIMKMAIHGPEPYELKRKIVIQSSRKYEITSYLNKNHHWSDCGLCYVHCWSHYQDKT